MVFPVQAGYRAALYVSRRSSAWKVSTSSNQCLVYVLLQQAYPNQHIRSSYTHLPGCPRKAASVVGEINYVLRSWHLAPARLACKGHIALVPLIGIIMLLPAHSHRALALALATFLLDFRLDVVDCLLSGAKKSILLTQLLRCQSLWVTILKRDRRRAALDDAFYLQIL